MFRGLRILNINIMTYTMQQINAFNDAELKEYVYQLELAVSNYNSGKKTRSEVIKDFCLESCGNGRDYRVPYWGIAVVDLLRIDAVACVLKALN